jgi:hypothetical protein
VRDDRPISEWGGNWIGYSRYDGVVVTGAEFASAPPEVRTALFQYAEAGGVLVVLGDAKVPPSWRKQTEIPGFRALDAGFGTAVIATSNFEKWGARAWEVMHASFANTAAPWQRVRTIADANLAFPVVEDTGIPVRGLFFLMVIFALVIGPINFWVLTKRKQKMHVYWTIPAISLVTCLGVFAFMLVSEGWSGHARAEGLTILDENTRRAATVGWAGYYTPMTPGDGLHFGADTELLQQLGNSGPYYSRDEGSSRTLDWTNEQHLSRGWLNARVPAHFALRKSESRRERVVIGGSGNVLTATNGLGADIDKFWYVDALGHLFTADKIPAGGQVNLTATGTMVRAPETGLRSMYTGDWAMLANRGVAATTPQKFIGPRMYAATLSGAPFIEPGMTKARTRQEKSIVIGIQREGGDEG